MRTSPERVPLAQTVRAECAIEKVDAKAYRIPTEQQPEESDGTLTWNATTLVVVHVRAGGVTGMGASYADAAAARLVRDLLADVLVGNDAFETGARYAQMVNKIRNNGRGGISAMAISAVDVALWDCKAKAFGVPLYALLGGARERVPVYGSGGFTSYDRARLTEQLGGWVHDMRIPRVKMKVGRDPNADPQRVRAARRAIGDEAELFVDANGAYVVKQALEMARRFEEYGVCWYEEPVYHQDLAGNAFVRERAPASMEISNGEYGFAPYDFRRILDTGAADVLQADVTRCGGVTGFLAVDALCEAYGIPLSSHCAPSFTLHAAMAACTLRHVEYFHDHVLIERRLFDGTPEPQDGYLLPDSSRPGIGLEFKEQDAREYLV